jgi:hypothetical protein
MEEHIRCLHEKDFGALWEIIKVHSRHVAEGDQKGGFRDRLLVLELSVKELKERFWQSALIGGIIGALVGTGSKDVLVILINWFMKK